MLIALIALARKFIILAPDTRPATIAALSEALLALGVVYWLLRERDDRLAESEGKPRWLESPLPFPYWRHRLHGLGQRRARDHGISGVTDAFQGVSEGDAE